MMLVKPILLPATGDGLRCRLLDIHNCDASLI